MNKINNLLPSTERLLQGEIERFEATYHIRRRSAATRVGDLDLGEFLQANIRILIRKQSKALLSTHLQWLSMLFLTYLPGIYGRNDSRIYLWRQRFRVMYNSPFSQLVCGRRFGKTETTSIFVAACAFSLRSENWVLMSASAFCSEENLKAVKIKVDRLCKAFDMPFIAKSDSAVSLVFLNYHGIVAVRADGFGDKLPEHAVNDLYMSHPEYFSTIFAIAPTDKASRGKKGSVWIDENLFVDKPALQAVVPLVSEGDRIMVLTCSKNESDPSRMLELIQSKYVDNGEMAVNVLVWSKKCAACEAARAPSCPHPKPKPSWLVGDISYVRAFMEIVASDSAAGAELDNESSSNEIATFAADELLTPDHTQWIYPHAKMPPLALIFISTDPSGGGTSGTSNSAFVTFFLGITSTHDVIILDIIKFPSKDFTHNAERTILRLEALRAQPFATSATIVFAPERNLSHYASDMNNLLMRKVMFDRNLVDAHGRPIAPQPVRLCNYIMYRVHAEKWGVWTTHESKVVGTNALHSMVLNHRLFVAEKLPEPAIAEWGETHAQMANWCMTPNAHGKYIFGANGLKTDHMMALLVGVYALWNWTEGKAREMSLAFESTCCLCNCSSGLCGRRVFTKFVRRE